MAEYETIRFEAHLGVGTLTLARSSKLNALSPQMWHELTDLARQLDRGETLRCLVVTGEGPSFCAGMDLAEGIAGVLGEWADRPSDEATIARGREVAGLFNWISKLACPSIAAVRGHAYGAGLQLALACDLRIFADNARVGLLETRYGLLPDMGATFRLPRIVGEGRARELILLGEVIDAAESLRIGLANWVVADADLESEAQRLAERLAAQPPLALAGARQAIEAWCSDDEAGFNIAVAAQIQCLASRDFAEARRALAEGRTPHWQGR